MLQDPCFLKFDVNIDLSSLPAKFNYPFCYEPHPLAIEAAENLQNYIEKHIVNIHDFGDDVEKGIGKMFGVLVVKNQLDEIGYLAAFSGKLGKDTIHDFFVPPVYDLLQAEGFYREGENAIMCLNREVEALEIDKSYLALLLEKEEIALQAQSEIIERRKINKIAKQNRDALRQEKSAVLSPEEFELFNQQLIKESLDNNYKEKNTMKFWRQKKEENQLKINAHEAEIKKLKDERKKLSAQLQSKIFSHYKFINEAHIEASLISIFNITGDVIPPSGAGECAAPKLLQHAFKHKYKIICMAEFWWGRSPSSEIRKHKYYYPACRGKCEPILNHMLQGIDMEENPLLVNPALDRELPIIFEDDHIIVVCKPEEFLSVPGKNIRDSVETRIKSLYPGLKGPVIIHRLDMSTSGIMILAKNKEVHEKIQHQFIHKKIKKKYIAMLDGNVENDEGIIDLPMRVDLDDRPRQMICYDHGKPAQTYFKVISREEGKTRIQFEPHTGRTHQLRVHASHSLGLNCPILGDDLYGIRKDRLYLHAESIEFFHPIKKEKFFFEQKAPF